MPKVSVIIPTHKRAERLRRAITSVLAQTFQDYELLIVDDVSSDHTPEVVAGFDDTRIRYLRNHINKGDAGTRNIGIQHTSGEYIAFLDDDDEWLPDKLARQVATLEASPADVAGISTARLNIDSATNQIDGIWPVATVGHLLQDNFITTSSILLRRSYFETAGLFDEAMLTSSDYDMWLRIARSARFVHLSTPLVKYYMHAQGLSKNLAKVIQGIEILLAKHHQDFARYTDGYSQECLALGVCYCQAGNTKKGRAALWKAIRLQPTKIRLYWHFGLALLGPSGYRIATGLRKKLGVTIHNYTISSGIVKAYGSRANSVAHS